MSNDRDGACIADVGTGPGTAPPARLARAYHARSRSELDLEPDLRPHVEPF